MTRSPMALSRHNIGTVLRFRCKSECAILSMPKTVKSPFVSQNTILSRVVFCVSGLLGSLLGTAFGAAPFPHLCITGGITSEKHDLTNTHLHRASPGKALYAAFAGMTMAAMLCQPVFAATVWEKANEIMKDVYNQILLISTIAAIVTASVALLLMNFSRSGRTVDESRAWLKRIIITWAILNGLGFIMSYVTPFFADGRWNG